MIRIAVIGSRKPSSQSVADTLAWLDSFRSGHSSDEVSIITGGALGMDTAAMHYAYDHHLKLKVFVPRNFHNEQLCCALKGKEGCEIIYTNLGYQQRNTLVIENADLVVSSDYGNGTIDSIEKALNRRLSVYILGRYIPSSHKKRELPHSEYITLLPSC